MAFGGAASHALGLLAATLGRWEEAGEHFAGALALHTRIGARPCAARTAAAYAAMLIERMKDEGGRMQSEERAEQLARARELLAFALAEARSLGMTRLAAEAEQAMADHPASFIPHPSSFPSGLTPREAEVLRLLATGASNREIADTLVVSVRTVERHLLHVYDKIDARRRGDAVAYALRHGLA
jgi:DNA-binding CsgD family transcriptional regulator